MRIPKPGRAFAAPFVMIVTACGSPSKPVVYRNPPRPEPPAEPVAKPEQEKLPEAPANGTATKEPGPNGTTVITYESGDKVYVHPDGKCVAEYSGNCGRTQPSAEPIYCNPPPPQQVQCPPEAK